MYMPLWDYVALQQYIVAYKNNVKIKVEIP